MPLSSGERLGPYEILGRIGAGGMGEVYKARDTRLDRIVAVKVSKDQFSERFAREARAIAALNHPNICHLYDVGPNYLVMEFVEGAAIGHADDPLKLIDLASQIADGLVAAHQIGIVHRDLKPGNIMVTRAGQVKILDFGLAVMEPASGRPSDATETMALTEVGTTVGTVAYMSPEQARGQTLDARSDLWSLGVLLYETATGSRPFEGATNAILFDAILNKAPMPAHQRNPKIPAELERIIDRLLEKDRALRYQSPADLRADLKRVERDSGPTRSVVVPAQSPPASQPANRPADRARMLGIAAAVVAVIAGGVFLWQRMQAKPLTDKDVLVLAEFTNTTNDSVFDGTLREALSVQLDQSPFLKAMSDEQVQQDLKLMGRSPTERITNPIAREICQREGEKATIGGSIANLGKTYAITLQATNCATGDSLAREQAEAEDKDHVLKAVASAARAIRAKLGESLSSIQKQAGDENNAVTTQSLEAFQAFALGAQQFRQGTLLASIPFFKQATERDPNFAMAWLFLGTAYAVAGGGASTGYLQKAFDLRDRVSERERYYITVFYYQNATRQWDKAVEAEQLWMQAYPRSLLPRTMRGLLHRTAGEFEDALQESKAAYDLEPRNNATVGNLINNYVSTDRFDEAKAVAEKGFAQGLGDGTLHGSILRLALLQGDQAAQAKEIQWFSGKPEEYLGLSRQADQLRILGQRTRAGEMFRQAADAARRQNVGGPAAQLGGPDPLGDALMGDCNAGRNSKNISALALCGDPALAESMADQSTKAQPLSTLWNAIQLPIIRATVALRRDQPDKAIELLQPVAHYERNYLQAIYVRGQAYLKLHKGAEAAAEFQKILDHKGANWGPYYPVSYVWLARSAAEAGDSAKCKKAYQDFFALWKDADPDIPILMDARKEYQRLN